MDPGSAHQVTGPESGNAAQRALNGRCLWSAGGPVSLARVRLTEFWAKMREQFGDVYAQSVAQDYVLAALGSRTVNQALADGEEVKVVWHAVCEAFRVPERLR
jgi:hypothetical protein